MYIGQNLQVAYPSYTNIDDISGSFNGVTTSFALTVNGSAPVPLPLRSNQCLISVGGVIQRPDDTGTEGFRLSGGNIIFSSAPNTGEDFFGVILAGADYVNVGANFPSGTAAAPSITFDTDLDTGIYNSGANQLSFSTAGTERLRIDSAGQIESVSLGTAAAPAFSFVTDPNTGIYSSGADVLAVTTGGVQRLTISAANATFSASVLDSKGDLRAIPQNSQTSAYVLVAADAGRHISITTGGVTVPSGVFAIGDTISIYNNSTSNQTITQGGSVTLRQAGTANTGNRTLAQYGVATVICVASNTFVISGAGLS